MREFRRYGMGVEEMRGLERDWNNLIREVPQSVEVRVRRDLSH